MTKRILKCSCFCMIYAIVTFVVLPELILQPVMAQDQDPVSVTAEVETSENSKLQHVVSVKLEILDGWHTFDKVPDGNPAPTTVVELELPDGIKTVGEWKRPVSLPSVKDAGATIFSGNVKFTRAIEIDPSEEARDINVTVSFQACDDARCQPPAEITTSVEIPATEVAKNDEPEENIEFKFESKLFDAPFRLTVGNNPLNTKAKQMYPSPAMFDVDNDGKVELIVGDIFGSLNVYENDSDSSGDPVWLPYEGLKTADGEKIKVSNW